LSYYTTLVKRIEGIACIVEASSISLSLFPPLKVKIINKIFKEQMKIPQQRRRRYPDAEKNNP
jgi:hypothetical protein